jgi:hypothetical protein
VTCDEVRELLPEHLLGTLEPTIDREVRQHLRGCAACRAEMASLGDGLATFARAAHDREPPADLRERVLTVLDQEWRDAPVIVPDARTRRAARFLAAAAAVVLFAASIAFGLAQTHRANLNAAGAASYRTILNVLGGEDFRIGTLVRANPTQPVRGNVILYDAHSDQSWGLVILHAPGMSGGGFQATLWTRDGTRIPFSPTKLDAEGDGSAWIVSTYDLHSFDKLTLSAPDGTLLATARIRSA